MTQRLLRKANKTPAQQSRMSKPMIVQGFVNGVPLEELPLERQMAIRRRIGASFQEMCYDIAKKQVAEEHERAAAQQTAANSR